MLLSKLDKGMSLKETQLRVEDREKTTADIVKGDGLYIRIGSTSDQPPAQPLGEGGG